mmetsp:Transcript_9846/g.10879  ORF Transcript_9846/g.10879 Transcript_9846/m.10879 type:complete len:94 (-) Transcript_9846:19-300(-)
MKLPFILRHWQAMICQSLHEGYAFFEIVDPAALHILLIQQFGRGLCFNHFARFFTCFFRLTDPFPCSTCASFEKGQELGSHMPREPTRKQYHS